MKSLCLAALLVIAPRALEAQTVKVDFDKLADFSKYKTSSNWQSNDLRTMVDIKRVKEGTLIVELYDRITRLLVWRSVASDTPASPDQIEPQIQAFVKKSFADFPPRPRAE